MPNRFLLEIEGHLGQDPKFQDTKNNKPSCYFSIACTKKGETKEKDKAAWFNITAYGYAVEQCHSLKKGMPVLVRIEDPTAIRGFKRAGDDGTEYINLAISTFVVLPILWKKKDEAKKPSDPPPVADVPDEDLPF
jgi:hypothetical protein